MTDELRKNVRIHPSADVSARANIGKAPPFGNNRRCARGPASAAVCHRQCVISVWTW